MKKIIIANWKCNPPTGAAAKRLFLATKKAAAGKKKIELVVCPPFCYLPLLSPARQKNLGLGAQNCLWQECGAYTGEVAPGQIADMKCSYVLVGHSERRKNFFETNVEANKKIKAALASGLSPVYCVGETAVEKAGGKTTEVIRKQIEEGLAGLMPPDIKKIAIAYEPVWAIGSGKACLMDDAREVSRFVRSALPGQTVLYGGSVNAENAVSYLKVAEFDGLLVGGVSLKTDEFKKLMEEVEKSKF